MWDMISEQISAVFGSGMWRAGAIGLACGAGQMPLAAMATGIVLVVLYLIRLIER